MRLLIVDDEPRFAGILCRVLQGAGYSGVSAVGSAEEALPAMATQPPDLLISDLRLPGMSGIDLLGTTKQRWPATEVLLMTGFADVATAREALKRGALDYLVKPFDNAELLALIDRSRSRRHASGRFTRPAAATVSGMVGTSPAMRRVVAEIEKVARSDASSVLILGESGTGKELAASAVHGLSNRHRGPFIEVHTGALPETVIESELFGHERGAFTGADKRKSGLCELASGGTIFLDEIGEMPLHLQPRLLRFLQERRFYRVGGTQPVSVDTRVVAATNRDLAAEARAGRFREDLYYRLDVACIALPPLRERREDVRPLVEDFLRRKRPEPVEVADETMDLLVAYDWPGNIRELFNVLERALILREDGPLLPCHLSPKVAGRAAAEPTLAAAPPASAAGTGGGLDLGRNERQLIEQALRRAEGNKTRAAELLGITRRRLYSRMHLLGMETGE